MRAEETAWVICSTKGNVSDVLLKFQRPTNQYNTKELPHHSPLLTIEIGVLKVIICSK